MPTDPTPVDPKVEMLPELWKDEDATLQLTFLMIGYQLPQYVCWNKSNTMVVGQIQNATD